MGRDLPERIAHYQLEEKLGEGGFGIVYRAWDLHLETHVALKIPKLDDMDDDHKQRIIHRFLREARAAARMPPHTNLCPVREVGEFDGFHYVVMAYISGQPLSHVRRPLETTYAIRLVGKIARAMQVAHDHDVIHRDLKPSNVMLVDGREPVVMDFGLAVRMDVDESHKTTAGRVLGTPAYMSLEQIEGDPEHIGPHSDVYSLGVILYELLAGQVPYQGTLVQMIKQIIQGEPRALSEWDPEINPELEGICLRAMSREFQHRYLTMSDFADALATCLPAEEFPSGSRANSEFELSTPQLTPRLHPDRSTLSSPSPTQSPFDVFSARKSQKRWANYLGRSIHHLNAINMELVLIPPGRFLMGSPRTELGRSDEELQHPVQITQPFYLGKYPVTQEEFQRVMNCNPSQFQQVVLQQDTGRFPVERVSWYDCLEFCNKLSARDGRPPYYSLTLSQLDERGFIKWASVEVLGGSGYRLPTEAEWESACRAGTLSATAYGDSLSSLQANFNGLSPYGAAAPGPDLQRPTPVGSYAPNNFGLYDLHGNTWEWCWDGSDEAYYDESPLDDPVGPDHAINRVIRGGCWRDRGGDAPGGSGSCRSAARHQCSPVVRLGVLGFRVAVAPFRS